jgi:uncharacterized protein (UPF0335 family)
MSYDSQLQKFQSLGMGAISRLVQDNSELFLSISEEEVARKIVALTRLHANELPEPQDGNDMYEILATFLGELLRDGKIPIAEYGLSIQGQNELRALVSRVASLEIEDEEPVADEFAEVVSDWKTLRSSEFKHKWMRTPQAEAIYSRAIEAGRI